MCFACAVENTVTFFVDFGRLEACGKKAFSGAHTPFKNSRRLLCVCGFCVASAARVLRCIFFYSLVSLQQTTYCSIQCVAPVGGTPCGRKTPRTPYQLIALGDRLNNMSRKNVLLFGPLATTAPHGTCAFLLLLICAPRASGPNPSQKAGKGAACN